MISNMIILSYRVHLIVVTWFIIGVYTDTIISDNEGNE